MSNELSPVSPGLFTDALGAVDAYYHRNPSTGVIVIREGFPPLSCWPSYDAELKADVFTHRA